jgi:hypothetical protein
MLRIAIYFFLIAFFISCRNNPDGYNAYKELEAKEIKRHVREDSLFFGIYLGMTSKQFYGHCWEMNKKGIFMDGLNNTAVLHKIDSIEMGHTALMNFYPDFYNNTIAVMRVSFQYDGWAPWNKQLYSDKLLPKVLELHNRWYPKGNPFLKIEDKKRGTIYVKVDGNRRIIIGRASDMTVRVDYTDLWVEQESDSYRMKNEKKK